MSYKISVITPSLNSAKYIESAIQSVLDQNYDNFEHIIVDGASKDGTIEILNKYNHLRWVSEPDNGQSNAMNKGFRMSTGDIIVYLNADDCFLPGTFESVIPYFEDGKKFVVGDIIVVMETGRYWLNVPQIAHEKMLRHWEPNAYCVNPVGYFYLREVQEKVNGFNEESHFTMDLEFLLAASQEYEFTKIDRLLGVYRFLPGTKTTDTQCIENYWTIERFHFIDKYLKNFPKDYVEKFHKDREIAYRENNEKILARLMHPGKLPPMKKKAIFIHSLFRTGSTYIWNKFRQNETYHCYYEPFHQVISQIDQNNWKKTMVIDYKSVRHPLLERHYLVEYEKFFNDKEKGIPYLKKTFSFDEFCNNKKNPDLERYIDYLIQGAGEKTPVLQFNRSAMRTQWFKCYYPGSLNVYLVRNPRDQWQSYIELQKRTQYPEFFVMDLLIPSLNLGRECFHPLSKHLPLLEFHDDNLTNEINFYQLILDSYSLEERYFIFYYTWLRAFIENVLNTDFIININLLTQNPGYRQKIINLFKEQGVKDIDFEDCSITEYSAYTLSQKSMRKIENKVQKIVLRSVPEDTIQLVFDRISKFDSDYFQFHKNEFIEKKKYELKPYNIQKKTIEKFKTMVFLFSDKYLRKLNENTLLKNVIIEKNRRLKQKDQQLEQKEKYIQNILNSYTYKIGKIMVFPFLVMKRLINKVFQTILLKRETNKSFLNPFIFIKEKLKEFGNNVPYVPDAQKKINLHKSLKMFYGSHRSGWLYALKSIKPLHNKKGVLFDSFIERTFNWSPQGIKSHKEPWIGVIHVPPNVPEWFCGDQSNDKIFETNAWKESYPYCKGLFTLCEYHKKNIENKISVPVNTLVHPTETPALKWSWDRFEVNKEKKMVQIGWWLRKLHTIYQLPVKTYKKIFIKIAYADVDRIMAIERDILKREGVFKGEMYDTAAAVPFLPDREYDLLLSENIVIANLYDSSANNLLIECIVRNTPILINPLEAIVEYLGEDYPFYFNSLEEAAQKAENVDLVYKAHQYLIDHPIKEKLTGEYFRESFINSPIYRSL